MQFSLKIILENQKEYNLQLKNQEINTNVDQQKASDAKTKIRRT